MAVLLNRSLLRPSRVGVGPGAAVARWRWNEKGQQRQRHAQKEPTSKHEGKQRRSDRKFSFSTGNSAAAFILACRPKRIHPASAISTCDKINLLFIWIIPFACWQTCNSQINMNKMKEIRERTFNFCFCINKQDAILQIVQGQVRFEWIKFKLMVEMDKQVCLLSKL